MLEDLSESKQFRVSDGFDAYNKSTTIDRFCIMDLDTMLRSIFLHDDLF